ncbi:hypothetical protein QTP86_008838 [Hemibagrus guttatus]|nr:hypothetical protein QTP86_008838 [Hemibagrus guttatus]
MVVCRMTLMVCKTKRSKIEKKTKWWKLKKEECCEEFRQKLRQALGGQVVLPDDWETTAEVIRETGRKVLGVSSGRRKEDKETWWWNEEVQDSSQRKRLVKKKWDMDRTEENRQEYKELQRRVKREVSKAKQKAYDELYTRLDTREGEKDLYRLARQRDRDGKDVQQVRVIKDRDGRVLTTDRETPNKPVAVLRIQLNIKLGIMDMEKEPIDSECEQNPAGAAQCMKTTNRQQESVLVLSEMEESERGGRVCQSLKYQQKRVHKSSAEKEFDFTAVPIIRDTEEASTEQHVRRMEDLDDHKIIRKSYRLRNRVEKNQGYEKEAQTSSDQTDLDSDSSDHETQFPQSKKYLCNLCGMEYTRKRNLDTHMKTPDVEQQKSISCL